MEKLQPQRCGCARSSEPWALSCPNPPSLGALVPRLGCGTPKLRMVINNLRVTCKGRICARGGDLAVREIGAGRCLMESRITDLPGSTCNHQLPRFPLSSPLLVGLLQGQGLGGREEGDFQISS